MRIVTPMVALIAFAITGVWAADTTSPAGPPPIEIHTPEEIDVALDGVRRLAGNLNGIVGNTGKDSRGRTADDDINSLGLSPETESRLITLRDAARAANEAHEMDAYRAALDEAGRVISSVGAATGVISYYWFTKAAIDRHRRRLEHVLARLPEAERKSYQDRSDEIDRAFTASYSKVLVPEVVSTWDLAVITEWQSSVPSLLERHNTLRLEAVAEVVDTSADKQFATLRRIRSSPCPAPATVTSGTTEPQLNKPVTRSPLYPPSARRDHVEGLVHLKLTVSETGCLEEIEVVRTSGDLELDESAINWAEQEKFIPAGPPGKSAHATAILPVRFKIEDEPTATSPH